MVEPVAKAYKPWIIASLAILVGSLALLTGTVTVGFLLYQGEPAPLWTVVLGAVGVLGVGVGFAGFFLMMALAAVKSFRDHRRVQVLPPDLSVHSDDDGSL